jgi:osmoprotectant transport system substrate-binding protein
MRWRRLAVPLLVAAFVSGGCGSDPAPVRATALGDDEVTVGSFDFAESRVLGAVYGGALEAAGVPVRYQLAAGPRELVDPALARGLVELVPEYAGTAVAFLSVGEVTGTADPRDNHAALRDAARDRGMVALAPAPAQDVNTFAVRREVADRFDLHDLSDLQPVAPRLRFGGPPECPERPLCLGGLRRTYDLRFGRVLSLDAGGPLTHQAFDDGLVDVALVLSTDPALGGSDLVALRDDRSLQPAENVTPLVHREVVERWGDRVTSVLDRVSERLTTDDLRALGEEASAEDAAVDEVASRWLEREGIR